MSAFFEICVKGFRSLMVAKPKWHFVRELISNSFDEVSVKNVEIKLIKEPRYITIICTDDGDGFERLSDAFTLFAHTKKRSDASVRGRFNMGEKELASISKFMSIETTTGKVVFKDGKRFNHPKTKLDNGTIVTAKIGGSKADLVEILKTINHFKTPFNKNLHVMLEDNQKDYSHEFYVNHMDADWSVIEKLETTLFDEKNGGMRPTKRNTEVQIFKTNHHRLGFKDEHCMYDLKNSEETSYLLELGIPVQEIECNYSVNVNQKIPLNANRDSVKDSYLRDIYALVLNATHTDLDESDVSDAWVRMASDDDLVSDEAFESVKTKRYGEKAVFWSSDMNANEDAMSRGYKIIHGKEVSQGERDRLRGIGMVSSSIKFKRPVGNAKRIPKMDYTDNMYEFRSVLQDICKVLNIGEPRLAYIDFPEGGMLASYERSGHVISINMAKSFWMKGKFDPRGEKFIDVLMHELAHINANELFSHDRIFYDTLSKHSARLYLALKGGK